MLGLLIVTIICFVAGFYHGLFFALAALTGLATVCGWRMGSSRPAATEASEGGDPDEEVVVFDDTDPRLRELSSGDIDRYILHPSLAQRVNELSIDTIEQKAERVEILGDDERMQILRFVGGKAESVPLPPESEWRSFRARLKLLSGIDPLHDGRQEGSLLVRVRGGDFLIRITSIRDPLEESLTIEWSKPVDQGAGENHAFKIARMPPGGSAHQRMGRLDIHTRRKRVAVLTLRIGEIDTHPTATPVQRRNGTLWTTLYWSALRLGEALALKVDDVDLERRSLTVFGRKTRRWRQLPICAPLARVLARWLPETGDGPELFPRLDVETGGTLGVTTMSKAWCAFQRSVGIPDHRRMRAHDLRHAFGRHATAEGLSLRVIQHMMGHASIQTTLLYADCELGDVLAQMERCGFVNGR